MAAAILVPALFAFAWSDHVPTVSADRHREPWSTVVFGPARTIRRSARDMRETRGNAQGLELTPDFKTTGQKFSSDEYHTLSSLTSDNAVADDPPATPSVDVYPPLAIADPSPPPVVPPKPPQSFSSRGRYVGSNPHTFGGDGRAYRPDVDVVGDQLPDYSTSSNGNAVPHWNRYYSGHRQLKKYGPMIMETDVSMTDGDGGGGVYNGYDNGMDYNNIESESYKNQMGGSVSGVIGGVSGMVGGGDNAAVGWYTEPATQASRPAAEIRDPASSKVVTLDMKKLVLLAVIKAALAKLKVLAVLKFLAVVFVKTKLLALLKVFLFAKFAVMNKLLKLFVLPFLPNVLTWLRAAALLQLNPAATATGMGMNNMNNNNMMNDMNAGANVLQLRNDSVADPVHMRSTDFDAIGTAANLFQFVATVQSVKCAERTACRVAGVRPPSFQSVWLNWILSSMANYIPNRKLKSYVSTFKDVSDYRLENIFSHPSTDEWLKWCDERYYCDEETTTKR